MSFDKAIAELTAALLANTAALLAVETGGSGTKSETSTKPASAGRKGKPASTAEKDAYTAKYTQSEMQAAVNEVKSEFGTAEAKRIIKEVGGHDRLADLVDPKKIDEVYEAARTLIEGGSGEGGEEDGL